MQMQWKQQLMYMNSKNSQKNAHTKPNGMIPARRYFNVERKV